MAKRKSTLSAEDYFRAYLIDRGNGFYSLNPQGAYIKEIDSVVYDEANDFLVQLEDEKHSNPEKMLLKKEAWQLLSEEAREVIDILLKAPAETLEALSTPTGLLTKRSIQLGLQRLWKSKFIARLVVEEITRWANRL